MLRYALRRLAAAVPVVLGVLTLTFLLVESAPGSPVDLLLGDGPVPPEIRQRVEHAWGLDQPPAARYVGWLASVALHGDLGWSPSRSLPVARVMADALPPTLGLAGAALLVQLLVGIGLGVVAARWRGRWPDRATSLGGLALYAMPTFWIGLMAILALAYAVPLFPPASMRSVGAETWTAPWRAADLLWHLALPAAVLGLSSAAALSRFVRAGVSRTLAEAFVRAARARGAGGGRIVLVHALGNSLLPVITLLGLSLPILVSGSLAVEVVFAWPGMGRLAYEAILARDLPLVLSATLLASCLVVLGSLLADLALAAADPRIRLGSREGEA